MSTVLSDDRIQEVLNKYSSANLMLAPTAIHHLERLSSRLRQSIYIKRDDLTGFGVGGNKVRKLEYLLGDALEKKADTLVTKNASGFSRNAAIAGKALGFEVHVFIVGQESAQNRASQSLFKALDANLHFCPQAGIESLYEKMVEDLRVAGRSNYELHPGGSDSIGSLSYLKAFDEIREYSKRTGIHFGKIIHATGSTATQVGLVLGQGICGYDTSIIGMAISQKKDIQRNRVLELARRTAEMLGVELDESKVIVDDGYIGSGYPNPSPEELKAAEMFARCEGILLDQVYVGKAAAGLIDYAVKGKLARDENVLFIHTGGNFDLYYWTTAVKISASREKESSMSMVVRDATEADIPSLLSLMRGLAEFEKYAADFRVTEDHLRADGFRRSPRSFYALLAQRRGAAAPVGMAVYYFIPFTFRARPTLFVKELFVRSSARGKGVGELLMAQLARIAVDRDCWGIKWQAAAWNDAGRRFYERLGAVADTSWVDFALSGYALDTLAKKKAT